MEACAPRLKVLDTAAESLRRIVNDVLDFSKIDAGKLRLINEPFRPIDALESLALTYAPMVAGRAIRFHLYLSPSLDVEVIGDRTRLVQVFNNLLSNAFKFTASGRITVSGDLRQDEHGTQRLVCRVSDSGIGMPPSLLARAFQPFVQGDAVSVSRHGGTGLGLSICARLCELMGGSIAVDSVQDVGSAFTVSIPLAPSPEPALSLDSRSGHVMVLYQDARTGDHLEAWLNAAGWRTNVLGSLAAVQETLHFKAPQVIVATDEYPLETLASLREATPITWCGSRWRARTVRTSVHPASWRSPGSATVRCLSAWRWRSTVRRRRPGTHRHSDCLHWPRQRRRQRSWSPRTTR
ncbi:MULTISPECIES: sensor histidine kinase [Cupriavidus]|uniref:sensor histidine kinase n=1 Tax=Cupriavidus sp. DF5525 TaxID=3160989 RepID=UPI0003B0A5F7|nr:hypothetical protein N234_31490 [Ralstonia pickettii DTP0602]